MKTHLAAFAFDVSPSGEVNKAMVEATERSWDVLLIGGSSGVGKSTAAQSIGKHYEIPWLQVDDFRLALQASRATLPNGTSALYFFETTPNVYQLPTEPLRDGLIAVGEVLTPAIEKVIDNHVSIAAPVVLEGDAILPALFTLPLMNAYFTDGRVRIALVEESSEEVLLANIMRRLRTVAENVDELRKEAHVKWLYGQWLREQAETYRMPLVPARPYATLAERILVAVSRPLIHHG